MSSFQHSQQAFDSTVSIFQFANVQENKPPARYFELPEREVLARIQAHKTAFGDELLLLGHHYQMDEIIKFADLKGDSYKLSKLAAEVKDASYIVFLGVHFMAESADILTSSKQQVILPDMRAGCTMADMANIDDVTLAWEEIAECTDEIVIPITYMNSTARLKNFVGRNDGVVCTSSNAETLISWALERGEKVFFFPDQHLGRNTAFAMGYSLDEMLVWDPALPFGGNSKEEIHKARFLLWKGHCSVHQGFHPEHAAYWREQYPDIHVIVHPECCWETVQVADSYGSTGFIIDAISKGKAGSKWAIGTEIHLVNRLQTEFPEQFITSLSPYQCLCSTMYRIRPAYLLWVLDKLAEGVVINKIVVPKDVKEGARIALQRMIEITG